MPTPRQLKESHHKSRFSLRKNKNKISYKWSMKMFLRLRWSEVDEISLHLVMISLNYCSSVFKILLRNSAQNRLFSLTTLFLFMSTVYIVDHTVQLSHYIKWNELRMRIIFSPSIH
jgi:hypothetical protein